MSDTGTRGIGRRAKRLSTGVVVVQPKRPSTKSLLLDTAELLFARYGLEGISLREIGMAAGQANPNVVQYHFEDKAGLINAILVDRVKRMDEMRGEQLNRLKKSEHKDTKKILRILWSPWIELKASDQSHAFCRFFLQYIIHSDIARHPVFGHLASNDHLGPREPILQRDYPYIIKIMSLLREQFKTMPDHLFARRIRWLSMMFFSALSEHDYKHFHDQDIENSEFDIEPILDMAFGALRAPF